MRVLLFEPHLSEKGHSKEWCWNLYKLLNIDIVSKVIFLDFDNILKTAYKEKTPLKVPYEIVNISDSNSPQITSRGLKRLKQQKIAREWYSNIIRKLESLHGDLMIITTQDVHLMYQKLRLLKIKKIYTSHTASFIPAFHKEKFKKRNCMRKLNGMIISGIIKKSIKNDKVLVLEESTRDHLKKQGLKRVYSIPYMNFSIGDITAEIDTSQIKNNRIIIPGMIYEGKNHENILKIIENNKDRFKGINIHIAGHPRQGYGTRVAEMAGKLSEYGVTGNFKYLTKEELKKEILRSKFVLIPYSKIRWDQSSGILYDAISNNRPCIVPDILPFKNYFRKYNIGLTYKDDDTKSFIETLERAIEIPINDFFDGIRKFKSDNTTEKIREKLKKIILD